MSSSSGPPSPSLRSWSHYQTPEARLSAKGHTDEKLQKTCMASCVYHWRKNWNNLLNVCNNLRLKLFGIKHSLKFVIEPFLRFSEGFCYSILLQYLNNGIHIQACDSSTAGVCQCTQMIILYSFKYIFGVKHVHNYVYCNTFCHFLGGGLLILGCILLSVVYRGTDLPFIFWCMSLWIVFDCNWHYYCF